MRLVCSLAVVNDRCENDRARPGKSVLRQAARQVALGFERWITKRPGIGRCTARITLCMLV